MFYISKQLLSILYCSFKVFSHRVYLLIRYGKAQHFSLHSLCIFSSSIITMLKQHLLCSQSYLECRVAFLSHFYETTCYPFLSWHLLVQSKNTRLICEICSKLTPKASATSVNLKQISYIALCKKFPNTGKYGPEKTPCLDTFYTVPVWCFHC